MSSNGYPPCAVEQRVRDCHLLPGLAQSAHVNLDCFAQSRNHEIPFSGQTVSPATRRNVSSESLSHQVDHVFSIRICEQVQIAAKIGPVIERLDHGNLIGLLLKCVANPPEILDGCLDPRL